MSDAFVWPATTDPSELEIEQLTAAVDSHLEATEQVPLDPMTNRWLGEAAAIAADIATDDVSPAVATARGTTIVELLEQVDEIETETAREHVTASLVFARELAART